MKRVQINLLSKKEPSLTEKVIFFCLHYLRYIIIITQIVVIGVFFYRFQIDQEIIDLKESVTEKQEIFRITKPLVDEAKALDKSADFMAEKINNQERFSKDFDFVLTNIPSEVILNKFNMSDNNIQLEGFSIKSTRIKQLSDKLSEGHLFKDVSISKIDRTEEGFNFIISITRI